MRVIKRARWNQTFKNSLILLNIKLIKRIDRFIKG